jgi:uncharacterized protein
MLPEPKIAGNQSPTNSYTIFMKLHLQTAGAQNTVTAYGPGYVEINRQPYRRSLVLLPDQLADWTAGGFDSLVEDDFRRLLDFRPELLLLGTGERQRFPHPGLLRPLIEARIGYEVMDLQAACRTYNILMAEGRRVAAALLFD